MSLKTLNKRKVRDILRFIGAILLFWLYIPHVLIYLSARGGGERID